MRKSTVTLLLAVLFCMSLALPARAADDSIATVAGHARVVEKAQLMRMTLVITATGADAGEAASKLKQQRDELKTKLVATGASEASIQFSGPLAGADAATDPRQRAYREMYQQRSRTPATSQPVTVTLVTTVTAEWPLTAATPDEAVQAVSQLQARIKDTLPKPQAAAPKTPEEAEAAEEMAGRNGEDENAAPTPKYVFVCKLSDAERDKAMTDAFVDAQAQAKRLATASGHTLGTAIRVATESENPLNDIARVQMAREMGEEENPADDEVTGDQVNDLSRTFSLVATFKLN